MEMVRRPVAGYSLQTRLFRLRPRAEAHRVACLENDSPDRRGTQLDGDYFLAIVVQEYSWETPGRFDRQDNKRTICNYRDA